MVVRSHHLVVIIDGNEVELKYLVIINSAAVNISDVCFNISVGYHAGDHACKICEGIVDVCVVLLCNFVNFRTDLVRLSVLVNLSVKSRNVNVYFPGITA